MFAGPGFDGACPPANLVAGYLRRHGPWELHRLPLEALEEYATMPTIAKKLVGRWEPTD